MSNPRLKPGYTGHLRKVDGKVTGVIQDSWGWVIRLTATPDPNGGYVLSGILGDPPPDFRVPLIDDDLGDAG